MPIADNEQEPCGTPNPGPPSTALQQIREARTKSAAFEATFDAGKAPREAYKALEIAVETAGGDVSDAERAHARGAVVTFWSDGGQLDPTVGRKIGLELREIRDITERGGLARMLDSNLLSAGMRPNAGRVATVRQNVAADCTSRSPLPVDEELVGLAVDMSGLAESHRATEQRSERQARDTRIMLLLAVVATIATVVATAAGILV